jgi:hypothetical protein
MSEIISDLEKMDILMMYRHHCAESDCSSVTNPFKHKQIISFSFSDQEFQYDVKLKRPWDPRLSDSSDNETKDLDDHIQSVVSIELSVTYIKVLEFWY